MEEEKNGNSKNVVVESSIVDKDLQIKTRDDLIRAKDQELKLYYKRQSKLEASIQELEEELQIIQEEVKKKDEQIRKQRLKIGDYEQEVKRLGDEVHRAQGKKQALHVAEKHNRDLLKILEGEELKQEGASKENAKLQDLLRRARAALRETQRASAEELAELRETLARTEAARRRAEAERQEAREKASEAVGLLQQLQLECGAKEATLEDEVARRKEAHYKLVARSQGLEDQRAAYQDRCEAYEERAQLADAHNRELTQRLKHTQSELLEAQGSLKELRSVSQGDTLMLTAKLEAVQREKASLAAKVDELSGAVLGLVAKAKAAAGRQAAAEERGAAARDEAAAAARAAAVATEQLKKAQEAKTNAESQRAAMKSMMDEMKTQMKRLNERVMDGGGGAGGPQEGWGIGTLSLTAGGGPEARAIPGGRPHGGAASGAAARLDRVRRRLVARGVRAAAAAGRPGAGARLDLSEAEIDDSDLQNMLASLASAQNIHYLDLSSNKLTDSSVETLIKIILDRKHGPLHLDCRNNGVGREGARRVARALDRHRPLGTEHVYGDRDGRIEGFRSVPSEDKAPVGQDSQNTKKTPPKEVLEAVVSVDLRDNHPDQAAHTLSKDNEANVRAQYQSLLEDSSKKERKLNKKRAARLKQAVRNKIAADVYDLSGKKQGGGQRTEGLSSIPMGTVQDIQALSVMLSNSSSLPHIKTQSR